MKDRKRKKVRSFATNYSPADAQLVLLVTAAKKIMLDAQKGCGRKYTPTEELWFDLLEKCLVEGSERSFLNRIIISKGVPRGEAKEARQEVAGIFILAIPTLRESHSARAIRSFLRKTALTHCRSFRRSELKLQDDHSSESGGLPGGMGHLTIRRLRRPPKVKASIGIDEVHGRTRRYREPAAEEPESAGRVLVGLPGDAHPGGVYLLPEFARCVEALPVPCRYAILLRICGYSIREGAEIVGCTQSQFKLLLLKARLQLRKALEDVR